MTTIGQNAFNGCAAIPSIKLPSGITKIEPGTFSDCSGLSGALVIPSAVTSIGEGAFSGCSGLTSVTIPDSVKGIGQSAFYGCSGLKKLTLPISATIAIYNDSYNTSSFKNCNNIEEVVFTAGSTGELGNTNNSYYQYLFEPSRKTLKSIRFEEGIKTVPMYMCYNCEALTTAYLPSTLKAISEYAFYGCKALSNVAFAGTKDDWAAVSVGSNALPSSTRVHYNCTSLKGHYMVEVGEKAATCTEAGHTAGTQCALCGTIGSGTTEIPALGHDFGEWTVTTKPTCTEKGTETKSCSRCDATETREVAALDHNYVGGKCTRCGEKDPNYIAAPVIKITTSAGKPKISWSKVDGAVKYQVYRSTDGKKYDLLATTTGTSITNTKAKIGTKYYYKVRAVNSGGALSEFSNGVSIKCVPAAPTVSISRVSGKAKLSWKAVSGATKYWVYRSTDGKKYTRVAITTKLSYADSKSKSGTKYYYKVMAVAVVNETNVGSACSAVKSITTTLAKPSVKITTVSGKPKLSWSKVTGADKYYVYRSTNGKDYTILIKTTKTSVTNTSAKKGTKYYYKVKAICSANTNANSAFSTVVSIKATK